MSASVAPTGPAGRRPPGRPAPPPALPARRRPPEQLAAAFARLFLEVEAGQRPCRHLACLMDPLLWRRLVPVWARSGPAGVLLTLFGLPPQDGVYDAVALIRRGPRVGALCLRLAHGSSGWRVTEAARPEDGVLPDPERDLTDEEGEFGMENHSTRLRIQV